MNVRTSKQAGATIVKRIGTRARRAYTLAETLISMAITGISLGGIVSGYIFATRQAEWSAYSLAGQSLAAQRLEQTRAAKWTGSPAVDEVINGNFPTVTTNILDMPVSGTNVVFATNFTSITDASTAGYPLKLVRVDCVWSFREKVYTNTVVTYRAPDQ